jgi:Tfp pilus assembly protein PilX
MIVTLIFLILFACMAVAITTSAETNLTVARNRVDAYRAAALAEAGIQLVEMNLGGLDVPGTHDAADLHQAIAGALASAWAASTMVNAAGITWDGTAVTVPTITLGTGDQAEHIDLTVSASGGAMDDTTITIQSAGRHGLAACTAHYNMTVQRGASVLGAYGIASRSAVTLTGNARISGVNNDAEGSILSATYSAAQAIRMTGIINVSGDVAVCNPDGIIKKTGIITIGGDEIIGAPEPEWPQVDISGFRVYAKNVYAGSGAGTLNLSNIRIPAGTNPTFSGNLTVTGIVYVESPNKVTFSGNTNLCGAIVCETPAVDSLSANYLRFTGNMNVSGVENLPAGAQYDGLRGMTGSFLLAPGYSAQFSGNFHTVSGCMVASEFQFTGNASGIVRGGIVNLRDSQFSVTGNANIQIDKENAVDNPAGLTSGFRLVCVSGSYSE